jgi:hypothetical protein
LRALQETSHDRDETTLDYEQGALTAGGLEALCGSWEVFRSALDIHSYLLGVFVVLPQDHNLRGNLFGKEINNHIL